jgi:hypothetical protein
MRLLKGGSATDAAASAVANSSASTSSGFVPRVGRDRTAATTCASGACESLQ